MNRVYGKRRLAVTHCIAQRGREWTSARELARLADCDPGHASAILHQMHKDNLVERRNARSRQGRAMYEWRACAHLPAPEAASTLCVSTGFTDTGLRTLQATLDNITLQRLAAEISA